MFNIMDRIADASFQGTGCAISVASASLMTEHLKGKAGVLSCPYGDGRVVLFGIDATYRGQPLGTAKMFFQAILTAGE